MQRPAWQATVLSVAATKEPSSAVTAGVLKLFFVAWQAASRVAKCAISDEQMPSNIV